MWELLFNIVSLIHLAIWFVSFFAVIRLIYRQDRAYKSAAYIGVILIAQGLRNGCPVTDIQNWLLSQYHGGFIENKFLLDWYIPTNNEFVRILAVNIGIVLLFPIITKIYERIKANSR